MWHFFLPKCLLVRDVRGRPRDAHAHKKWYEQRIISRCNFVKNHQYRGIYALLLDLRVLHSMRPVPAPRRDNSDAVTAQRELVRLLQDAESGRRTTSSLLRKEHEGLPAGAGKEIHKQLTSYLPPENPRICPVVGLFPDDIELPPAPTMPTEGKALQEALWQAIKMLRNLDTSKAAGPDGISNRILASLLRLKDHAGAEMLLNSSFTLMRDDLFSERSAPLLHAVRRAKGSAFEKPLKPGKFRILDLPTWLLAFHARHSKGLESDHVRQNIEPYQLALTSGGPDALAHIAFEPPMAEKAGFNNIHHIVTIVVDVKQCYPETDAHTTAEACKELMPRLLRLARVCFAKSHISSQQPGTNEFDVNVRRNGLGQGLPASSILSAVLTAKLLKAVDADLTEFYDNNNLYLPQDHDNPAPTLTVTGCHDNFLLHVHRDAVQFAIQQLKAHARNLKYRLDDWGVYLHGTTEQRDDTEKYIERRFGQNTPIFRRADDAGGPGRIFRPDITENPRDLLIIMGVPISSNADRRAASKWFKNKLNDDYKSYCERVLQLSERAQLMSHGEHAHFAPGKAATQLAFSALKISASLFYHLIKATPNEFYIKRFAQAVDDNMIKYITKLLRLESTHRMFPKTYQRFRTMISRSTRTGGANCTMLSDLIGAGRVTSRSLTAEVVKRACKYPTLNGSGTLTVFKEAVDIVQARYHFCRERADAARVLAEDAADAFGHAAPPEPHCPVTCDDPSGLLQRALDRFEGAISGEETDVHVSKVPQGAMTQAIWRQEMRIEYFEPEYDDNYFPSDWTAATIKTHLRTATTQAIAANGGTLWGMRKRYKDPFTRRLTPFPLDHLQFLVAVRQQLGFGLHGLVGPYAGKTCSACSHRSTIDDAGYHLLYTCASHRGHRNQRHAGVQRAYEELARRTPLVVSRLSQAPNVTPLSPSSGNINTPNVQPGKQEFGDWSVYDGDVGKTIIFDNTIFCGFTAEARDAAQARPSADEPQRKGFPALYAMATRRRRTKYTTKQQGCEDRGHLFMPLINTHNGAFVPQDPKALQMHVDMVKRVFGDSSQLGRTGSRPRSAEEAIIRRWSRKVANVDDGGKGIFDASMSVDRAAGLLVAHTHRRIAHAALRSSANAAIHAVKRNGFHFTA